MDEVRVFGDSLTRAASILLERVIAHLPGVIAAILLMLVGWLLAKLMRSLTKRAMMVIDAMLPRLGLPSGISSLRAARSSVVAGTVVYWVVLLLFITAATQVLGLQAFTDWLAKLIDYLPTLAAGMLIFAAGWLMSGFAADLVQATVPRLEPGQRDMLARIVRVSILVGAILIGADQIGIRITFLAIFVGAIAVTVGGGVALAVGLGSREYVSNLIAAHQLRQAFAVGQTLRIAGHEGRLLEVTATGVIIETAEGRVVVPARLFQEEPVTVKARAGHG
ncbi:MAG TPA: mechanosensitive ion channel [Usitatibacteraceae bacterium]|nr:mechanosensitive ion channel [Usitatibacteraceae bacterium]